MVVIDALTYVGESVYLKRRFTAEDLIEMMDTNGIDMAVVTAPPPGPDYQRANEGVYEAVRKYPDRLVGFYKINPWFKEAELERAERAVREWGFRGFKLDPKDDSFHVGTSIVKPVMELAEMLEVPIFFQTGDSSFCPPEAIAFMAPSFPKVTIIMSHTDLGVRLATYPRLSEDLKNIYFGTYPLRGGHKGIDRFLRLITSRTIDPKRVVFTTEMPFGHPKFELKVIELSNLDEEAKKLIMGENIKRILRL